MWEIQKYKKGTNLVVLKYFYKYRGEATNDVLKTIKKSKLLDLLNPFKRCDII